MTRKTQTAAQISPSTAKQDTRPGGGGGGCINGALNRSCIICEAVTDGTKIMDIKFASGG
jgi:hypothetical protein